MNERAALPVVAIAAVIEANEGDRIRDIRVIDVKQRLYSTLWTVAASFAGGASVQYIVKRAGSRAARRQLELSRRADALFAEDPNVISPALLYLPNLNLLIARRFPGVPLSATMSWHPLQNPIRWHRDVRRNLRLAGQWLARYHAARRIPSSGTPLLHYIENRSSLLSALPRNGREELLTVAREPFETDFTIVHGDFTAGNILVGEEKLCVIDFGIQEWTAMAGWWDVASLLTSLQRSLLFSKRSPAKWIRGLLPPLERAFLVAYGGFIPSSRDYLRCLAVRHFSFWSPGPVGTVDERSSWHFQQLAGLLDELCRRKTQMPRKCELI